MIEPIAVDVKIKLPMDRLAMPEELLERKAMLSLAMNCLSGARTTSHMAGGEPVLSE